MLKIARLQPNRIATALVMILCAMVAARAASGKPAGDDTAPPAIGTGNPVAASAGASAAEPDPAVELRQLEAALDAQSQKLAEHARELDDERAALHQELQQIADLEARLHIGPGSIPADPVTPTSALSQPTLAGTVPIEDPQQTNQPPINIVSPEHPLSLKLGAAYFTPGGFVDLTGIFRSADVGSGLSTNLTTLPYSNSLPLGQLSEFRFTGQGSRTSLKVEAAPTASTAVTAYIESDFNGFEPANSNISQKSDTFRLRLAFVEIKHDRWDLVTGQTWSLLTPTREGISPFPENVFTALRLDTSYLAGLVYDRQPGMRVVYHPTKSWALAVALENPQQFVPGSVVFPTDGSTNLFSTQFDNGSSSTSAASSAVNPTVPNLNPDIIVKSTYDRRRNGKLLHVEIGGLARSFRVYDNLITPAGRTTTPGGGGQFNVNYEIFKNLHLIENTFYGDGVGRYIGGLGPDVIVRPNGTLSGVHAGSAIVGAEWQATPRLLLDAYSSGAYFWRNYDVTTKALGTSCGASGTLYCVGFGFPGSANTNNRDYQEATFGIIPTIWSSPNYGKLQFISQFSYVVRSPWYVAPATPKNAHAFIAYINLRYIVP